MHFHFMRNPKRVQNFNRFRLQFPEAKTLTNKQICSIFKMYRICEKRSFQPTNVTLLVTGSLIIMITGLFINGGVGGILEEQSVELNAEEVNLT